MQLICIARTRPAIELWNVISRNVVVMWLVKIQILKSSEIRDFLPSSRWNGRLLDKRRFLAANSSPRQPSACEKQFSDAVQRGSRNAPDGLVRAIFSDWFLFQQFSSLMLAEDNATVGQSHPNCREGFVTSAVCGRPAPPTSLNGLSECEAFRQLRPHPMLQDTSSARFFLEEIGLPPENALELADAGRRDHALHWSRLKIMDRRPALEIPILRNHC